MSWKGQLIDIESSKIKALLTIQVFSKGFSNFKDYNSERTLEALWKFIASDGMNGGAIDNDVSFEDYDKTTGHDEW